MTVMNLENTILREGRAGDWLYIDSLRKREGDALGFIPKDAYLSVLMRVRLRDRARHEYQTIWVTEDNGDLTGYCYVSFSSNVARIIQIVVQQDARRWHRALMMTDAVEAEAQRCGKSGIVARVAYDLESNWFWKAIGYWPVRQTVSTWLNQKESKSKRPLWVYHKEFMNLFREGNTEQSHTDSEIG